MRKNGRAAARDELYTSRATVDDILDKIGHNFEGKSIISPCDSPRSAYVFAILDRCKELRWSTYTHMWRNADGSGDWIAYGCHEGTPQKIGHGHFDAYSWCDDAALERYAKHDVLVTNPPFSSVSKCLQKAAKIIDFCVLCHAGLVITNTYVPHNKFWSGGRAAVRFLLPNGKTEMIPCVCVTSLDVRNINYFQPSKRLREVKHTLWRKGVRVYAVKDIPVDYTGRIYAPFSAAPVLDPKEWRQVYNDSELFSAVFVRRFKSKID